MVPNNFSNLTLREGYMSLITKLLNDSYYYSQFFTLFVNYYTNRLLPEIRQFFLIPNRMKEFVDRI
jgi:hypothetical protein